MIHPYLPLSLPILVLAIVFALSLAGKLDREEYSDEECYGHNDVDERACSPPQDNQQSP
jgi:hypothetical protein